MPTPEDQARENINYLLTLRAGLVEQAEDWCRSSLQHWRAKDPLNTVHPGPTTRPDNWLQWDNQPLAVADLEGVRHSVNRGTPYGSAEWVSRIATELGLSAGLRPRGRPKKDL